MRIALDGERATAGSSAVAAATLGRRLGHLSRVRTRWSLDPLLVGVVALLVYALHGYVGGLSRDLGVFTYGGEHVAKGVPPYVGIFNSVGPLADAVPGLAIWLGHAFGADPILASRVFFTGLSALCCVLLSVLARDTLCSRAAGFVAPAVFLTFLGFLKLASDGPREKTTMVLFLLACLVLLGRRRWAAAGACAALATLTWQPALLVAVAALVAAMLLDRRSSWGRILLRFAVGGLAPTLVALGYFVGVGALGQAVDGFVVINARYTTQPSAITQPSTVWPLLWDSYRWTLPLIAVGIVATCVLAARALPFARRPMASPVARRLVVAGAGALVGTVWTLMVVNGGPDLFVLLPFAALGIAGTLLLLVGRISRRGAVAALAALAAVAVLVAGVESVTTRDGRLVVQRADVAAVLGSQPGGATVVSIDAPEALALAGRSNPVPYQLFSATMTRYLAGTYPGGMRGFEATLRRLRPTFVVVGSDFHGSWPYRWLNRDYARVGGGASMVWYLRRSAGVAAIFRARAAHAAALATARH